MSRFNRASRVLECVTLFFLVPTFYIAMPAMGLGAYQPSVFPALGLAMVVCLAIFFLHRIPARSDVVRIPRRRDLARVVLLFEVLALPIGVVVLALMPESFLYLPREIPGLWLVIMIFYPMVSVLPQEFLYRRFFFRRYEEALGSSWMTISLSALLFGYVHLLFGSWVSVAMTAVGGALFAWTYHRTRSLLACSVEHALYGCFVFTIGLGQFFYYPGARESDDRAVREHVDTGSFAEATLGDGHAWGDETNGVVLEMALDGAATR